jgi:hypothetical protein
MRLFLAIGKLTSRREFIKAAPKDQRPEGINDKNECFMLRGGKFSTLFPAFDLTTATNKAPRLFDGVVSDMTVHEIAARAFHPARWDEATRQFYATAPHYCDTVTTDKGKEAIFGTPAHVRLATVHHRLTCPTASTFTSAYNSARAAYKPRAKSDGTAYKSALKATPENDREAFTAGWLKGWAFAAKFTPATTKPATRSRKKIAS